MRWRSSIHLVAFVTAAAVLVAGSRAALAQQPPAPTVTGVVVDQTKAVLGGARVELLDASGSLLQSAGTDATGAFQFATVPAGRYQVVVSLDGFRTTTVQVTVGTRPVNPLRIALPLASVTQHVTVNSDEKQVTSDAGGNADAIAVDQDLLESLPVMNQDYIATLSQFLDTGSLGTGGVTIVVNGMEVNGLNVSASAIQQIKINQDPYSAEYSRPGRGRIEILTKPGSQEYHGDGNVVLRDARFDARNAFAATRPPEQRRIFEGFLGGPVGGGGRTMFMLSGSADTDDQSALVFALSPAGHVQDQVPQPNHRVLASGSLTRQVSETNSFSIRPTYQEESNGNRGVGGTTLASAGTDFLHREWAVTYTQQTILSPSLINQFQFLAGPEREPTTSVTSGVGIVVPGSFIGGGAQGDNLRTEHHFQASETVTLTKGHHLFGAGFQIPDWSRRRFDDNSNTAGTFYFADLASYAAGQPYAFTQNQGNGHVVLLEKVLGMYLKDDWQATPHVTASAGLRYDWTNHFHDHNNFAPRGSLAYAPGNKSTVFRAGAGLFFDKPGPAPFGDVLASRPGGLRKIVLTDPGYPNPFALGASLPPPSIVQFAPDIQVPQTLQYSAGVERQVRKGTTVALTYIGSKGSHLFLSRDINAPLPPLYAVRPDPAYEVVREIESAGRQRSDALQATLRGRVTKWFNGQAQYTLGRADNNTGGLYWYPANDYDLSGEYARADFDRRHRFQLLGRVPAHVVDLGVALSLQSGTPYSETVADDIFHNARGGARPPGVGRNSLDGAGYADLDLRAAKDFAVAKGPQPRTITIALDVFNVLNHVNDTNYVGVLGSPLFGQPVGARPPRQLQFSMHVKF